MTFKERKRYTFKIDDVHYTGTVTGKSQGIFVPFIDVRKAYEPNYKVLPLCEPEKTEVWVNVSKITFAAELN